MSNVLFFARNPHHLKLYTTFIKSDTCLSENVLKILYESNVNDSCFILGYEKKIQKLWIEKIDIDLELSLLLEKYHDFNLNRALLSERELVFFPSYFNYSHLSYKEVKKYVILCFKVMEEIICEEKVDFVFGELILGLADAVLYSVCKKQGVSYVSIRQSKVGKGFIFCDPYIDKPIRLQEKIAKFKEYGGISKELKSSAIKYIESTRLKIEKPEYMEKTGNKYSIAPLYKLKEMFRRVYEKPDGHRSLLLKKRPLRNPLLWHLYKLKNIFITKINYKKWFVDSISEEYFVFPLHYEPESSTLVRGFYFSDQLAVIKFISKNLPYNVVLVVKEHGGNQGYRKSSFYNEVSKLPNVELLGRNYPVNKLIKESRGVITITGRMGWESIIIGKPVLCLGDVFWNSIENVFRCNDWTDLEVGIEKALMECVTYNEEELVLFTAAYLESTNEGNFVLNSSTIKNEKNIQKLCKVINQYVKENNR